MRGITNRVRFFISEAQEFGLAAALREHRAELGRDIGHHFGNHLGGSTSGVFIRLPFTRFSAWLEWREVNCGLGLQRTPGNLQVWIAPLEAVFSTEPRPVTLGGAR